MPASTIIVQHRDGSPARRVRVVLGFHGLTGGMTDEEYTDDHGEVTITHSSVGKADVYVSGKKRATMHAPGRTSVVV
ncbi:MAG: hypothetical protein AB1505_01625 [Candidatus Latescibacterota bacterium]